MSFVMRKRLFAYVNKDADQLRSNCAADQRLVFAIRIVLTLYYLNRNLKPLSIAIFCSCTAQFVWDLVGNPEDWFSHNEAHMYVII